MDLHGVYPLLNSINTIELRINEIDSACGRREMCTGLVVGKSEDTDHHEEFGIDGRIKL